MSAVIDRRYSSASAFKNILKTGRYNAAFDAAKEHQHDENDNVRNHVEQERRDVGPPRLQLQLHGDSSAEKHRPKDGANRRLRGEDDKTDGDEAGARGHTFLPGLRVRDREMSSADAAQ